MGWCVDGRSLTFAYVTRSMCDVYVLILKAFLYLGQDAGNRRFIANMLCF